MNNFIVFLLVFLVSFIWGTTWIAMKIVVSSIPPIFATGLRFLMTAPLSMFTAWITKTPLFFPVGQRMIQIVISIFYFSIPFTLMLYGGRYVNVPTSSLIFSSMPIIIVLFSYIILDELINTNQKFGIFFYFISLIFFLLIQWNNTHIHQEIGILLLFISLCCHAFIYVYIKQKFDNISILSFNSIPTLLSGITLVILGWIIEHPILKSFSIFSIFALCYLSIIVGFLGIALYFILQKKIHSHYASIVFVIFPLISLFLDHYIYKTKISNYEYIFIMFSLIGIIVTLFSPKKNIHLIKTNI